ncbi:hypothetical protein BG004_004540 [Podila humilis]|nr:hypothetical protein BG004_004540 [Podila humilis]
MAPQLHQKDMSRTRSLVNCTDLDDLEIFGAFADIGSTKNYTGANSLASNPLDPRGSQRVHSHTPDPQDLDMLEDVLIDNKDQRACNCDFSIGFSEVVKTVLEWRFNKGNQEQSSRNDDCICSSRYDNANVRDLLNSFPKRHHRRPATPCIQEHDERSPLLSRTEKKAKPKTTISKINLENVLNSAIKDEGPLLKAPLSSTKGSRICSIPTDFGAGSSNALKVLLSFSCRPQSRLPSLSPPPSPKCTPAAHQLQEHLGTGLVHSHRDNDVRLEVRTPLPASPSMEYQPASSTSLAGQAATSPSTNTQHLELITSKTLSKCQRIRQNWFRLRFRASRRSS